MPSWRELVREDYLEVVALCTGTSSRLRRLGCQTLQMVPDHNLIDP